MSGRKVAVTCACLLVLFAAIALSGGLGIGVSGVAAVDFRVTDADLEEDTIVAGDSATVTATVENVGNETGTFTAALETDADGVVDTTDVEVDANESTSVEFTETFDAPGTYRLSVNGEEAGKLTVTGPASAEFSVSGVTVSDSEVEVGESVDVSADVENTGDADGTYTAELVINGTVVDSESVDVTAGDTETVDFSRSFDAAGEYAVGVGDAPPRTLTVTEPEPANVSVTDAELSATRIGSGDAVTVTATVENDGGVAGEITAELRVDGATRDGKTRTLGPGERATVEFTAGFDEPGTYDIGVNDAAAGTLTVSEPAAFEVSNARLENDTALAGEDAVVLAEVANVGGEEGMVTVEARATGPDGDARTVGTRSVTLAGGESRTVELRATIDRPGEYGVAVNGTTAGTLTVESPADLTVTGASLEDDVVSVNEEVTVAVTVENVGDREGSASVAVAASGEERAATEVTVAAGESTTERLAYTATESGLYEITANGEAAGTLTVIRPATFETTNAGVDSETVLEGEPAAVTATVVNVGSESGIHTATLAVDGETVERRELVIVPGDSERLRFSPTFQTAGAREIAVNGEPAGTLSVLAPADVSIRETALSSETIAAGESATVTVELANDGDVAGEFTARLGDGNETLETVTRTVGPNGNETVRFERTFESAGEYELAVNDESVGTLAVLEPADVSLGESTLGSESVERNESVELTVELRNAGEATGRRDVDIALGDGTAVRRTASVPDNGTTVTVTHAYAATGEYAVTVDGAAVGNVTVVEPRDDSGSGGGGGGGGDGDDDDGASGGSSRSGSSGSTGGATTPGPDPTVTRSVSDEAVAVAVDGVAGEPYETDVDLAGPSASAPAVSLTSFAVDPAGERDAFEARVGRPTAEPDGIDAVPRGAALGYVTTGTSLDSSDTSAVTLRFTVDRGAIPDGLGPEDVAVLRYADGEWTAANVTHDVDGDAHAATLPRASPVAVVALEPGSVEIVETLGPADQVRAGYETTLRVTVENPGDRPANRTLTVAVNGESLAERPVTLEPGQNETVPIEFEPPEPGTVSLEGTEVGEIALLNEGGEGASQADRGTEDETPGFGALAAVLALVAAALAVRVRR